MTTTHYILPHYQPAYRRHYSCETALVKICEDILWAMDRQSIAAIVAIDLRAAFDTVDHDILLSVLEKKIWHIGRCYKDAIRHLGADLDEPLTMKAVITQCRTECCKN